jgi:predicted  nucleic acid-binding Zn-ribbon protein
MEPVYYERLHTRPDLTPQIMAAITRHKLRLLELLADQDELTAELKELETEYNAGHVSQEELDSRLEVLVPRHERQQQEIAVALAEIERLRQRIFDETGLELPLFL